MEDIPDPTFDRFGKTRRARTVCLAAGCLLETSELERMPIWTREPGWPSDKFAKKKSQTNMVKFRIAGVSLPLKSPRPGILPIFFYPVP
jgi:hypothetical protein